MYLHPCLDIIRLDTDPTYGTFGVLRINQSVFCCTLEPPDRLNRLNVSSIPAQQYRCELIDSPTFGRTYQVMDVPERSNILFHAGNTVDDTAGCILLGSRFDKLRGDRAVLNSGQTFRAFMDVLRGEKHLRLAVREVY